MNTNANPIYSLLLFISGFLSLVVTSVAWKRRHDVPYAFPMAIFSLGNAIWGITYALHWTNLPRLSEFFWVDMTYFGVVIVPTAFLAFSLCYTEKCHWVSKRNILLFSIQPLLTLVFLWTDPKYGFFFAGKRLSAVSVIFDGSIWFWFHISYSYLLIIIGIIFMLKDLIHNTKAHRGQAGLIIIGISFPLVASIFSLSGSSPTPNLDLIPFAFSLTGFFLSISIFRYGLLDLMPIAHDILFENLNDGVIVLDIDNHIIKVNSLAKNIFKSYHPSPIVQGNIEIQKQFPEIPSYLFDVQEGKDEFAISGPPIQFFEVSVSPLMEQPNILRGRLLTIRDITTRKQIELQLRSANQQLEVHLKEVKELQTKLREESIRDHLTGLFNQRYLHEILASGWSLAKRKNWPISLVMIDIDHFKRVNDKYGHTIGDQVLISLSNLLMGCVRKEDIICRFGGEEFIVVLPGASQIDTFHKVDQWRKTFQTSSVVIGNQAINLTFSAGVASFPDDGPDKDQMILMADRRMYLAKESGRNRVFDKRNDPLKNEED